MEFIISSILEKEWQMFQAVNRGLARADCQDDPDTFARMRCAQFLTWSEEACRSYAQDLINAEAEGRNLVEEKYIHMMEHCAEDRYAELKTRLPQISPEHKALAHAVNCRLIREARALREQYPFLNRTGRSLESANDTAADTSLETYQLGELLTFSQQTLELLLNHIEALEARGESLAGQIQLLSLQAAGFQSLEEAATFMEHKG